MQIALPKNLQGVSIVEGNVLEDVEREIALGIKPAEFTSRANITITAEEASGILAKMGIKLPNRIPSIQRLDQLIKETPRLSPSQIDDFYKQAIALKKQ